MLGALLVFALGSFFASAFSSAAGGAFSTIANIVGGVFGALGIVAAILYALIGYGLQKRRSWGRMLLLVITIIDVALALLLIALGSRGAAIFSLLVYGAILYLFGFQKDVKALFTRS